MAVTTTNTKQIGDQYTGRENVFIDLVFARSKRFIRSIGARLYTISNPALQSAAGLVLFMSFLLSVNSILAELNSGRHWHSSFKQLETWSVQE